MTDKTLTVAIPSYNVEEYLGEALDSIIQAGDKRIQVIIINDGSTDGTSEIAHSYAASHPDIFLVVDKENGGYGSTINASIPLAAGKYYRLLDGDDWFDSSQLVGFLDVLDSIDADLVFSPHIRSYTWKNESERLDLPEWLFHYGEAGKHELAEAYMQMTNMTFRTKVLKSTQKQITEHCLYTDNEFILYPLSNVSSYYLDNHAYYVYRIGRDGQSMSVESIVKNRMDHLTVLNALIKSCLEESEQDYLFWPVVESHIVRLVAAHYRFLLMNSNMKEVSSELSDFNKTIQRYPNLVEKAKKMSIMAKLGCQNNRVLNYIGHKRVKSKHNFL